MEIHLSKHNRDAKETCKTRNPMTATIKPKGGAAYVLATSSSKRGQVQEGRYIQGYSASCAQDIY